MALGESGKRYLSWVGSLLALGGICFVGLRLFESAERLEWRNWPAQTWIILGALAIVYGTANILVVISWRLILDFLGVDTNWWAALRVYAASQIARYLPGNIFHFAGRQVLGAREGWPAIALAKSSIVELVSLAAAGLLFGALVLPIITPSVSFGLSMLSFLVLAVCVISVSRFMIAPSIGNALFWHSLFLLVTGLVFVGVLSTTVTETFGDRLTTLSISAAYILAWLAGLVTPGAPAGVGIREFILLTLLGGQMPESELLTAIVVGRVVTVGGDAFFYLASFTPERNES